MKERSTMSRQSGSGAGGDERVCVKDIVGVVTESVGWSRSGL